MYIKQLTNEEFNKFKDEFNSKSLYQTPEYAFIMNAQMYDSLFLGLVDDEEIIAASLVLVTTVKSYRYAYAPRGFLIDYNNTVLLDLFTKKIRKYLGKMDIVAITISPMIIKNVYDPKYKVSTPNQYYDTIYNNLKKFGYKHLGYNHYFEANKPRYEGVLELDLPPYMLFRNIRKEFRTKIRSAEKRGVKIYKGDYNNLEYLYLQTKEKYPRDLRYFKDCYQFFDKNKMVDFFYSKIHTIQYLEIIKSEYEEYEDLVQTIDNEILEATSKGYDTSKLINQKLEYDKILANYQHELVRATKLLSEHPDGVITASALVIKTKDEVYLLMDGYDHNYKSLNSKHLLIWKLIEKYSTEGYKKFNFGGMSDPNLAENKYKGLNDFKLGFGSKVQEYIGDLELVTNAPLYFIFINNTFVKFFKD